MTLAALTILAQLACSDKTLRAQRDRLADLLRRSLLELARQEALLCDDDRENTEDESLGNDIRAALAGLEEKP